jgi:hypothetical protein
LELKTALLRLSNTTSTYFLDKVRHGLEGEKEQGTLSQDDVEKRLSQWLSE